MNYRLVVPLAVVLGFAARAAADPSPAVSPPPAPAFAHLHTPRVACLGALEAPTDCVQLAAGYFMDEPTYSALDTALRGLQDDKTRLTAENASLTASAAAQWQPGWKTLTFALLSGVVVGAYLEHKL